MLLWPVLFAVIAAGLLMVFAGIHDLVASDDPIRCGHKEMPEGGSFTCFTEHGPRTRDDLVRERDAQRERAPYLLAFGVVAVVIGAPGIWRVTRQVGRAHQSTTVT